ncbi:MAG: sensor histidine kinase N-terminal domain-containing protein [Burkholderiales bacterium]|nr:sensor histidine kinase N-terminal domain-containing protein [Burkholderiales bacterium]
MTSIRRRLLAGLLAVVLCAGLIAAFGVYLQARREANELFDYQLKQMALSLRDQTFNPFAAADPPELGESFDFVIQVWGRDGVRLYYSHPHPHLPNRARLGYETVATPDGRWRVFSLQQRGLTFQVAQPMSVRDELAATAAFRTLTPFLLLLPALGLLVWFTVGHGLRPLEAMARAVKARTPSALQPLPDSGTPVEIRPLVAALNDLLQRLDRTLGAQRRFVADAAHELRTPLTALRLQIQLAERAATAEERAAAFATVKEGLTRAAHLVDQLLTLARQEPEGAPRPVETVDLGELAREVIAEHMLLATSKNIDLGMARSEAVIVSGDRDGLRVMLGNLVDNAVRYTPGGGKIDVCVFSEADGAVIEVVDNGPGIAPEDRVRVFDRFFRGAGQEIPGSGLGLAIVKNIAERHHARVILTDGPGGRGLAASVVFPRQ